MRRIFSLFLCLLLLLAVLPPVHAAALQIVDEADILTSAEEELLEIKARSITDTYGIDVVIVTVESLHGTYIESYADGYYEDHGLGVGAEQSGVLFLLAMDSREWAITTAGEAIYALTDYGIEELFYGIADFLSDDEYFAAFDAYLDLLPGYFEAYENGSPIDGYPNQDYDGPGYIAPADREDVIYYPDYDDEADLGDYIRIIFVSLLIGAAAGGITLLILRGQMNTAKAQSGATNYMVGGSYALSRCQDIYLYNRVTRTRRSDNSSHGGRGGGSSIHRSSGGRSFGGRSGRF